MTLRLASAQRAPDFVNVGNTITIAGVAADSQLILYPGDSFDTVTLCSDDDTLDAFIGPITVNGCGADETLILNDTASDLAETYSIGADSITASNLPNFNLSYCDINDIQINSGLANATFAFNVGTVSPEFDLTAGGGTDNIVDVEGGDLNRLFMYMPGFNALNISGGTLDLQTDLSIPDFSESGGTLTGQANLSVYQDAIWSGGAMDGNGVTKIDEGASLAITGSADILGGRAIENLGSMTWSGGTITGDTEGDKGALQNWADAAFTAQGVFDGFFLNESELTPGIAGAAGTITVNGDYEETYGSTLNFNLGDEVTASGQIVLDGNLSLGSSFGSTSPGTVYTIIDNTGSQAISGTFTGLAQGTIFYVAT